MKSVFNKIIGYIEFIIFKFKKDILSWNSLGIFLMIELGFILAAGSFSAVLTYTSIFLNFNLDIAISIQALFFSQLFIFNSLSFLIMTYLIFIADSRYFLHVYDKDNIVMYNNIKSNTYSSMQRPLHPGGINYTNFITERKNLDIPMIVQMYIEGSIYMNDFKRFEKINEKDFLKIIHIVSDLAKNNPKKRKLGPKYNLFVSYLIAIFKNLTVQELYECSQLFPKCQDSINDHPSWKNQASLVLGVITNANQL